MRIVLRGEDLLILFEVVEQGFAIGNGLTDPGIQYKAYPDYALDMGIIEQADHDRINKVMVPACELAIKLCGNLCFTLFHALLSVNVVFLLMFVCWKLGL